MNQLVYTMFMTNNWASFRVLWKENLVKHKKNSTYQYGYLQNFLLLFTSLLTAKFAEDSPVLARISFIFLKNILKQTWNFFNTKFPPQSKDWKSSYQAKQVLALFWNLIDLLFVYNSVKGVRVTKILKEILFERTWGNVESKKCFCR